MGEFTSIIYDWTGIAVTDTDHNIDVNRKYNQQVRDEENAQAAAQAKEDNDPKVQAAKKAAAEG